MVCLLISIFGTRLDPLSSDQAISRIKADRLRIP
jgi:hypothetical protein